MKDAAGVSISIASVDMGPDQLWQRANAAEDMAIKQIQVKAGEKPRRVGYRRDNLDTLYDGGSIDMRLKTWGLKFKADFDTGQLSGYPSPNFEPRIASTGDGIAEHRMSAPEAARQRVGDIIALMGGHRTRMAQAAWDFIGGEYPLTRDGKGDVCARWKATLVEALKIIANFYDGMKKTS